MNSIRLISTVHNARGKCDVDNLLQILEKVEPEVIFGETSPAGMELIARGLVPPSLEINVVKKYSQNHSVPFIAVDSHPLPDIVFKKEVQGVFELFDQNTEYLKISKKHDELTESLGFQYLNSDDSDYAFKKMKLMEEDIVHKIPEQDAINVYTKWLDIHDKREDEMIQNIYSYCKKNKFSTAIFLCGAAHRKPIIDKLETKDSQKLNSLIWAFDFPE